MGEASDTFNDLQVPENLFQSIKFFVSGEVPEKVVDLLKNGGAERLNYFSDYVTHLICGENAEENDLSDANDVYEIPAITANWIKICIKLKKLVNTKPFIYSTEKLFSKKVFCFSKLGTDRDLLWGLITYHGGLVQLNFDSTCTHLVTISTNTTKYEKAASLGADLMTIVTPDWILESIKTKSLVQADMFHPKLIKWPKIEKHESTASITGFEPEKVEPVDKTTDLVTDSTQALLDKLKQTMPLIQQQTTAPDIAPPNVVAPSFLTKNQVRFTQPQTVTTTFGPQQQQVPRSVVHHTPQQMVQQQAPQFNLPNQVALNRLGPQNRPNLQQLRGQLGPAQLHHHLLQQRIQQNQQQNPRQLTLQQQQLLQQQLAQGQARQILQSQQIGAVQQQQPAMSQNQQFGIIQQQPQHVLQSQQQQPQVLQQQPQMMQPNQVLQQAQPQVLQQQQSQVLQQQSQVLQQQQSQVLQQQQSQVLQQQQSQVLQQQQSQVLQQQQQQSQVLQQQNQVLQQQQQNQILQQQQQQQQNQVLQQQQQQPNQILQQQPNQIMQQQPQPQMLQQGQVLQQQGQVLQQQQPQPQILQQKIFVSQQNPQIVQNQPNLAIQQQFVNQNQQQPQFPQQQFIQNQELNQPQQFQQNNIINQQLLLNQQNQFNQQQQQANQTRPQINQHIWQQQQQQQPQMTAVRHPVNIVQQGPRIQWSPNQQPNQPQRQFIQLDAQTHNELQKMNPEQQALFVQRLKQKQLLMQKQLAQRGGGGHILIRGSVPPGLNPQQQMQWLQRQAKQQGVVLPPNIQQQTLTPGGIPQVQSPTIQQHAPGLSPIQQQQAQPQFPDQNQQQQLQLRQQYRLQQLQLQREQAQKNQLGVVQPPPPTGGAVVQQGIVRPMGPVIPDSTTNPPETANVSQQLVVNAKTKTALANMLSNRLQSGGGSVSGVPETPIPEPSAAGTLRLMTAQHNAALNPNNRTQDLIALQQRRVINGPNGEIIRALVPQAVPVMQPSEAPKVPFSPRPCVPMQHRPGPYYGHNPNLKLPPDLFLLGCIFVVVEIERYLDESLPGWQQKIEKHGGEVEKQYCNRVTHVLCETQRHGVVMQALRDCKRCITIYWLSDVMKRKQVLPPWTALHLPTIYLDTTPASKHLITLSGFTGCDRNRVKHMINYTGAKFTSYFSKHNTLLIAAKGEGAKYSHAKKWGIPVVNVQWLTDVMLGHFAALNQMEHLMYQQFSQPPNFSFEPKLVPNLMHAWKMPINISQESYERVKRSPSPVVMPKKAKKLKTENTDENDNVDEGVDLNPNYRILFSMSSDLAHLQKIVNQLGGALAKNHQDCTHLVMPSLARSNKLLFCVCREVHIMPEQWLKDSQTAQKFLDEANYSLDTKEFNSEYKCDFTQTLNTKNRNKLFEGKFFWITPSVFPSKKSLIELVQSCGGIVEKIRRTAAQIEATNINSPYSYIIITHENDIHLVADLLRNKKDKIRIVCSAELIFSAILKQTFEVEPYAVKVL